MDLFCCCSVTQSCQPFATPWTAARQDTLSITNSWSLLKLMSIESVMPSNHLILCHPLLLLPSIFSTCKMWIITYRAATGWQAVYIEHSAEQSSNGSNNINILVPSIWTGGRGILFTVHKCWRQAVRIWAEPTQSWGDNQKLSRD